MKVDVGAEMQTVHLWLTKLNGSAEILGFQWWAWVVNTLQKA